MAKIYGLDGREIGAAAEGERTQPTWKLDTPEGKYELPVVILASIQYDQLRAEIASDILGEILPLLYEQLALPFELGPEPEV